MRRLALLFFLLLAAVPCFAATPVLRSAASGVSYSSDGRFRFSAEALIMFSTDQFNAGFRAEVDTEGKSTVYPFLLRARLGILSIEAGAGYDASDKGFAAYVMPAASLFFGKLGLYLGVPISWSPGGFRVGGEIAITLN